MTKQSSIIIGILWLLATVPIWLFTVIGMLVLGNLLAPDDHVAELYGYACGFLGMSIGCLLAAGAMVMGLRRIFGHQRVHNGQTKKYIRSVFIVIFIVSALAIIGRYSGCTDEVSIRSSNKTQVNEDVERSVKSDFAVKIEGGENQRKKKEISIEVREPGIVSRLTVNPSADKLGRKPQDVVVAFFEDVRKDDRKGANSWWLDHPDPNRVENPQGFDAFYDNLQTADRVLVEATSKGKVDYYSVRIHLFREGSPMQLNPYLTLEKVDDEWKILRSLLW